MTRTKIQNSSLSFDGGSLSGFRNAIINGNFDFWQRGTSFTGNDYQKYLLWLEEGNTPLPPDPTPEPEPLTAQQKLEAAGLTVEELKDLLGL